MASTFAFLSVGIIAYKTYIAYNTRKERKAKERGDPERLYKTQSENAETIQKRIILARLIYGMYDTFRGKPEKECQEWWTRVHYDLIPLEKVLTEEELHINDKELRKERRCRYFGVFRRKKEFPSPVAPDWVVAIRGTEPVAMHDLLNDFKIVLEMLHTSSLIRLLDVVISRLGTDNGYNCVCVTGHSLGAAAGLLVSRRFALKHRFVDCHLFNPPFATLETLVCSSARIATYLLSATFMAKCASALERLHEVGSNIRDKVYRGECDEERRSKALAEFKTLAQVNWLPNLYLNEHDLVCYEYISHFKEKACTEVEKNPQKWYSPVSQLYRDHLGDPETFHLIPKAVLYTINKYEFRRIEAHMLWNWIDPHISYELKQSTLVKM